MLVTVTLADHSRSKKEVTYDPYGRLTGKLVLTDNGGIN